MSQIDCNACSDLRANAPNFVQNGITDVECVSLAADTGLNPNLNPKHNDATDLHDVNDCLVGSAVNDLEKYNVCDWQKFMEMFIPNIYETIKGIICGLGGAWTFIHNILTRLANVEEAVEDVDDKLTSLIQALGGSGNVIPVMKRYRVNVPVGAFGQVWRVTSGAEQAYDPSAGADPGYYSVANVTEWFAGSGNNAELGEFRVVIPVSEMENITGVWTQTYVVPSGNPYDGRGKGYIQTVNIQGWTTEGTNLIVNFDTFELCPASMLPSGYNGGPYPVTVDFLVVGTKTFVPI